MSDVATAHRADTPPATSTRPGIPWSSRSNRVRSGGGATSTRWPSESRAPRASSIAESAAARTGPARADLRPAPVAVCIARVGTSYGRDPIFEQGPGVPVPRGPGPGPGCHGTVELLALRPAQGGRGARLLT